MKAREKIRRRRYGDLSPGAIVRVNGSWGVVRSGRRGIDFWDVGRQPRPDEMVDVLERGPEK